MVEEDRDGTAVESPQARAAAPSALAEPWWRDAVIYQIYPRSFADGNGDGTGDLAGIRGRLPYLRNLGVDAIWLTPWYVSPLADGGYDVADYRDIDPAFGTLAEAEALIGEASGLGIRTIIDIVPNHVSDQHPWFQAALAAEPGSPERERFWFRPGRGPSGDEMPTDWVSSFGGDTWTRTTNPDGTPGEWYLHLFAAQQPDLNWDHPDVRSEHEEILRFWFDRGVAGIRIDSAAFLVKDAALPPLPADPAPGAHPHMDRDELHDIYRSWREVADSYDPPRVLVGEVWLSDAKRFAAYLRPDEMHSAFNFDFMTQPWNAAALRESIERTLREHAPVGAPATWVLSNHDVTRPVTRYGRVDSGFAFDRKRFGVESDLELGTRRARAAALLTAALPGCLYVYQGDELGLPEVELPADVLQDPMHFRSGGIDPGRDGCRVPLPWAGDEPPYGFGTAGGTGTWLPQPGDWAMLSVAAQERDPRSMLALYRGAIAVRRERPDFHSPDLEWLDLGDDVIAFRRGDATVCITNLGPDLELPPHTAILLASAPAEHGSLPTDSTAWLAL
ncbi:glycoside hydrolase family 13 protein [Microbacterium immunditiarum]|uniref:Alpha-glucosidase n=1 Tax=Microbacterium immunditiarum TaxID=337480 RepID=A0A7Y9GNJ1_9MICO|nr:alpha-amylase family glycosyl hydrolase [Microbacterium immunditiarum]NYE19694.1 alpha-glucosidase [Microbacterium immunditiarum]